MSDLPNVPPEDGPVNHVAGEVSGSLVQAGVIKGDVHVHQQGRKAVSLPYRAGIPPQQAAAFQSRTETARRLEHALKRGNAAVLTGQPPVHTGVVSGLGGIGKTQVALDYAQRLWAAEEVDLWVWVTASSREGIVSNFARVAADLTGIEDTDPEQGARRLLEWLGASSARWLLVLDDVQNPADLRGLWPPAAPAGRVVVTTRRRDAALRGHGRCLIEVDVFTPGEAEAYLSAALAGQPHLAEGAAELATELGCLPLALAQSAAYMLDRGLCCTDYLARWTSRRRSLSSLLPEPDELPDEHRATVATTWSLSVEQANRLQPAGTAGALLEVASVLDPNGIPAAVFTTPAVTGLLARHTGREVDVENARDGLGCLHRLNLITLDPRSDTRTVRVHALVQRATRDPLPGPRLAELTNAVGEALLGIWPHPERDTTLGQVLRANTEALAEAAGDHMWKPSGHAVLFQMGNSLGNKGLVAEARNYFHQLHAIATEQLGSDHPDTLIARGNLARWQGEAGDPAGAAAAFERLLTDTVRVLGPDHPHTLTARSDLAHWRGRAGDPAGAASACERLLTDSVRVLGPDHPHTLTARSDLAHWRGRAGDMAGAASACEKLLTDSMRVLSPDHPDTLTARNNLAHWRGRAGDPAGAAAAFERLLTDSVRVLGPDHPHTLTARSNLARWRGEAGDPAGAASACEELLTDRTRVLGPDHPHTLTARSNLAHWRGKAGDPAGAAAAYEELVTDSVRVLGPDHPHTLTARSNLARWRGQAGDPAGAAAAYGKLLTDSMRVLGPDHPDTLTVRSNLARWRDQCNRDPRSR
ncbi:tetratricopeptide repeat protein [Amycolatopsis sp. NPDC004625]|uniref:tetratricopeptide repeat protein n=1 Tax=Amycolatopsis sp. NPDC004625 TaxID=3154670 RepID=UPI0033AED8CA